MTLAGAGGGAGRSAGNVSEQANDAASGPGLQAGFAGRFFGPGCGAFNRIQTSPEVPGVFCCVPRKIKPDVLGRFRV